MNETGDESNKIKDSILYITIIFIPIAILFIYIWLVISGATDWQKAVGEIGDHLGLVTALFTGLTFSALIIEIKIQNEDLLESRKQFSRSADAQEKTARLTAFSDLLKEYNEQIGTLSNIISEHEKQRIANRAHDDLLRDAVYNSPPYKHPMTDRPKEVKAKKNKILAKLEEALQDSGLNAS